MKYLFTLFALSLTMCAASFADAQDMTNAGTIVNVQPGTTLYVGTNGLTNQSGGTFTNSGTLQVDGALANLGTLDLGAGTLEVRGDFLNSSLVLPGTSRVTFSGTTDQLLTSGGASLYQVSVNKATTGANTLLLSDDLTVSNILSLTNGLVNTKNGTTVNTLRLPNGAALSGEASGRYVLGALQITRNAVSAAAVDFGHGVVLDPTTNNLGTVSITRTAGLITTDVSYGTNLGATTKGIDRIWTVRVATQPTAAVQLTLSWLSDNDNSLTNFSQARVWQQTATNQPWTVVSSVADASIRTITSSPTVLDRFTVSNAANPLPVSLIDFTARAEGMTTVRLAWATASELNNSGFTVERSLDALSFQSIGKIPGTGTSTTRHDYTLVDSQLPNGAVLIYYRLCQTDASGGLTYSPVRTVTITAQATSFMAYPTRVLTGQSATYYYTGPTAPATLQVLDLLGRVVRTATVSGVPQGQVPLAGLTAGVYLLRYTTAKASYSGHCVIE